MQVCIGVSRGFLELVEKNVLDSRPTWRANASSIDSTANVALLIADHSLFSGKLLHLNLHPDGNKSLYLVFVGMVFFPQHLGLLLEQLGQHLGLLLEQLGQQHLGCFVRTTEQQHLDCF
jgi:hypothetical protein